MSQHRAPGPPAEVGTELRDKLVGILLEYSGTPWHRLYEYPHTEAESAAKVKKAENTVARLLAELGETDVRTAR